MYDKILIHNKFKNTTINTILVQKKKDYYNSDIIKCPFIYLPDIFFLLHKFLIYKFITSIISNKVRLFQIKVMQIHEKLN